MEQPSLESSQSKLDMGSNIEFCLVCGDRASGRHYGKKLLKKMIISTYFSDFRFKVLSVVRDVKAFSKDQFANNSAISAEAP